MRGFVLVFAVFALSSFSFGQAQVEVCPKHIEAPTYPAIARTARVQAAVLVRVSIGANGTVSDAQVVNSKSSPPLLWKGSLENAKTWTFSEPPHAPYQLTITYEYRIDSGVPSDATRVALDLPTHISIMGGPFVFNSSVSRAEKN